MSVKKFFRNIFGTWEMGFSHGWDEGVIHQAEMQVMKLQPTPGQIIIFKTPEKLTIEQADNYLKNIRVAMARMGYYNKCIITEGVDISAVDEEKEVQNG